MKREEPNPASAQEQAEGSRENVNIEGAESERATRSNKDFEPKTNLPGKVDSGPEPDVFGREP